MAFSEHVESRYRAWSDLSSISDGSKPSASASRTKQALIWIRKAKQGSMQWVDCCTDEQFDYYRLAKRTKILGTIAKWGLLLCTIFDMPSWCRGTPEACSAYVKSLYSAQFPALSHLAGAGFSMICWTILLSRMWIRRSALGQAYSFNQMRLFKGVVLLLGAATTLLSFLIPMVYDISILCRPFAFLACTKQIRKGFINIMIAIPGFIDVLAMLAACIFLGTWIGMVIFARTPEGNLNFWSWGVGMASMWNLYSLNNTESILCPDYNLNVMYFWFLLVFVILSVYFLGNMLLARVYQTYKEVLKEEYKQHLQNQEDAIKKAFVLLSDGVIDSPAWHGFLCAYWDETLGGIQVADPKDIDHNITRIHKNLHQNYGIHIHHGSSINLDKFKSVMKVTFNHDMYIHRHVHHHGEKDRYETLKQIQDIIVHGYNVGGRTVTWDGTMDCLIAVGTVCTFYETWVFAHTWNVYDRIIPLTGRPLFWVLFVISLIYVFGITMRICALGFQRYWHRKPFQNRLDFVIVYTLIIVECRYMFVHRSVFMMKAILLLHIARAWRLIRYIGPLQQLFQLLKRLTPLYTRMFMILFTVYWIFCVVGQLWFGGLIYSSNPVLADTSFAKDWGYEMNFNCFLDGMITLFSVMIMDDWNEITDAYMKASGTNLSVLYFLSFTVIGNMIVFNILIALILDATGALAEESEQQEEIRHDVRHSIAEAVNAEFERTHAGGGNREAILSRILEFESGSSSASSSDSSLSSDDASGSSNDDEEDEEMSSPSGSPTRRAGAEEKLIARTKTNRRRRTSSEDDETILTKEGTISKKDRKKMIAMLRQPSERAVSRRSAV